MSKSRRLKKIKREIVKMDLLKKAISNMKSSTYEPDFIIFSTPHFGAENITSNIENVRRYCD